MENKSNVTGFFVACRNSDTATAKDLLKLVDPSSLSTTWEGRTCFHVAVIAEDSELLRELASKLTDSDFKNIIKETDPNGDTALHLAVRKNRVDMVEQMVELDASLCDCANRGGEIPLKLAVSLGFKEAANLLITRTSNALHYVVKLNQVKLVQFLKEKNVEFSVLINQPYRLAPSPSDDEGNRVTNPQYAQPSDGDQHTKEEGHTNTSSDGGNQPLQSAGRNKNKADEKRTTKSTDDKENDDTNTQNDEPIVQPGDTPLHIAVRNKFEHMVDLLLTVPGVNKFALNSEDKTPFEIAREVVEYHESFRLIRKLAHYERRPKPFMYCAPQVSHKKYKNAKLLVNKAYEERRNAELVVAALLATMTCAAAFTVPGGFDSDSKVKEDRGSPILISYISFKLFLIFDCIAFFLSLFVCIMWEMSTELTTGDKMLFMSVNSLVVCCSFGFTAYGFIAAVYAMLALEVDTLSCVVLGSLVAITLCGVLANIRQTLYFLVRRARFHRLCGVCLLSDDIVEVLWNQAERWGLLELFRVGDDASRDLITGRVKFCGLRREYGFNSANNGGNAHV